MSYIWKVCWGFCTSKCWNEPRSCLAQLD